MISECPHCNQNLRFSDANKERILTALGKLPQGQTLKFKCPICKEVIELNPEGSPPDNGLTSNIEIDIKSTEKYANTIAVPPPSPPDAPDISWLMSGANTDANIVEDVQTAMVIVPDQSMRSKISDTIKAESYQIYIPQNIDEAISSIRFKDYAIIVYHSRYENKPLKNQDFHKFIQQMSMQKRRYIYYILIGPEFHTLYDLEALANSANLVIKDSEIKFFSTIITKGKSDYKKLFNPYCSMLKTHGKS
ncbi:MAG: hypothetical protein HQK73_08455 [Desulfamplus sp.]|nr:hypothetical protein [Desulfamplus sp.]MBF0413942.1 hypothetical protein [Desulfamplus sp.]